MTEAANEPEPVDPGHDPGVDPPPDEETDEDAADRVASLDEPETKVGEITEETSQGRSGEAPDRIDTVDEQEPSDLGQPAT